MSRKKGKRMMLHIDVSGDPADAKKDRVYLMVDKKLLKNFVKDLLYGCMACEDDPDTNGFTAILAGQLMPMPEDMEKHMNTRIATEIKKAN